MKTKLFFCFVILVLLFSTHAQSQFVETVGDSSNDYTECVIEGLDGGIIAVGYTESFGAGNRDLLLTKFDVSGNLLWARTLGGTGYEYGHGVSVIEVSDGGLVVSGATASFGAGNYDLLLAKFDASGNLLWARVLGGISQDEGPSVVEASDGGLVVTGHTESFGAGNTDLLITKFDASGNLLWARVLGGSSPDHGHCVIEASDGGLVVTGETRSFGAGNRDLLLVKFDASGNHLWMRTLGGISHDEGFWVIEASDSGLVVTGWLSDFGPGVYDFLLAKFDASGNLLWARVLGGSSPDHGHCVIEVSGGGLVVIGGTASFGTGNYDLLLAKFDASGSLLWARVLGGDGEDNGYSVIQPSTGGLVAVGHTDSYGAGNLDLLLARFDAFGNTCLGESVAPEVLTVTPDTSTAQPTVTPWAPDTATWNPTITDSTPTVTVVCEVPPRIISITDVGNDQGREVRVIWHRCYWDEVGSPYTITEYSIWRRIDQYKASRSDAEILPTEGGSPYERIAYPPGEWDFIKTVPARCESTYSTICPTLCDSCDSTVADSICWSVFFVSAMTSDPWVYFDSDPDSGYSVDNLPPDPPKGLSLTPAGDSVVTLFWESNSETDLWYYGVYRDTVGGFTHGSSNLLGNTADTTYRDETVDSCAIYYYKVTAFDICGNESEPSNDTSIHVEVDEAQPSILVPEVFSLFQNYPNPFNPITEIKYGLPKDCQVKLNIYNILGHRVASLVDGKQKAGYKTARWDASSLSSGIYFYRLQAGNFLQTKKMVLIR